MKNKLTALLAALLLSFSALPAQALADSPAAPSTPPATSALQQTEAPDSPNNPEESEFPAQQTGAVAQSEEPDSFGAEH